VHLECNVRAVVAHRNSIRNRQRDINHFFMNTFLKSRAVRVGLVVLVLGTGPFLGFTLFERLGVFPELDPNPRYLATLAWLTAWPGGALIALGAARARRRPTAR